MANSKPPEERLATYRAKRSAQTTPEPFGAGAEARPQIFVVQKHAATRLHYDFRLEWEGVLLSWSVPKGPSPDPQEKRLAVQTEDHPVEYADFEGVIPEGNYGAGPSIVWDRGLWVPLEDPARGLEKGHLVFELRGLKLKGVWNLIRTHKKKDEPNKEWLLIKKGDDRTPGVDESYSETSILSGLTVEELEAGSRRADEALQTLERLKAPKKKVSIFEVQPMLPEWRERAFTHPDWVFELKYDGFRLLAARDDGKPRLVYRRGSEVTGTYPDVITALQSLPYRHVVFDGEVVVLDAQGRPSFQRLQKRTQLLRPADIRRAAVAYPALLFLFDLLAFEEFDLRPLPLIERKALLAKLIPPVGVLRYAEHFPEQGERLYEEGGKLGFEGVVGKRAASPYRAGRSPDWVKIRHERVSDFVVVGYTDPSGTRSGFGALHLAAYDGNQLIYTGRAGSGFSAELLDRTYEELRTQERKTPPCTGPLPEDKGHHWVEPRRVCEVRFKEWTEEGLLRAPVFQRFRDDKRPEECVLERAPAPAANAPAVEKRVAFTNPEKIFWPEEGLTKGHLVDYYRAIAPWLLPYLKDRPLVMTRFPDGIHGKSFFQKDAPGFAPEWLRIEKLWSDDTQRNVGYIIAEDVESLLYVANSASIPLHIWASRTQDLQRPDWSILDLDPKGAPFSDVVKLAKAIRALCDRMELASFPKTSGSTGLHVLIPLGGQCTFAEARALGELLARVIVAEHPDIATITRDVGARGGRVYVDYLQNGHGKLLVSPFSVRPLPGAPISMPLRWSDVNSRLTPTTFNTRNAVARMKRMGSDPLQPVLTEKPNLQAALQRLGEALARAK